MLSQELDIHIYIYDALVIILYFLSKGGYPWHVFLKLKSLVTESSTPQDWSLTGTSQEHM